MLFTVFNIVLNIVNNSVKPPFSVFFYIPLLLPLTKPSAESDSSPAGRKIDYPVLLFKGYLTSPSGFSTHCVTRTDPQVCGCPQGAFRRVTIDVWGLICRGSGWPAVGGCPAGHWFIRSPRHRSAKRAGVRGKKTFKQMWCPVEDIGLPSRSFASGSIIHGMRRIILFFFFSIFTGRMLAGVTLDFRKIAGQFPKITISLTPGI